MKITQFNGVAGDERRITKTTIDLASKHDGTFTALVPVMLPGDGTHRVTVALPFTAKCLGEVNNKKKVRIVKQANAPYQSVELGADGLPALNANRSGGEITCHVVISLPKAAADDLRGDRGYIPAANAAAQLAGVCKILSAMCTDFESVSGRGDMKGFQDTGTPLAHVLTIDELNANGGFFPNLPGPDVLRVCSSKPAIVDIKPISSYGNQVGLDLTEATTLAKDLASKVERTLAGLPPIAEDAELPTNDLVMR